ncbi:MAG: TonB-dependent receptor [Puniceicoccaceae bacterium]
MKLGIFRKKVMFLAFIASMVWGLFSPLVNAQSGTATINGVVTGSVTGSPVDGAIVQVSGTGLKTASDRFGRFSIAQVPYGSTTLIVRAIGYDSFTTTVNVGQGVESISVSLESEGEIFELEEFVVQTEVSGSARALGRQNAAGNRMDIVASDKFGLLPDPTVADAVRRLPGISVEKDSQGRSERYVSIRGMNSDFNSVAVNGQKVMVSNFGGASRSVPLDVVPSKNAESIEVSKTVLPSQEADAIGGRINIRSTSAFDEAGSAVSLEASVGMLSLADKYTGNYPHDETPYEMSASWSDYLNADKTMGLALSLNKSLRPYLFSSIENGPYALDYGDYFTRYGRLEEAFDNVESTGISGRFDLRPSDNFEMSLDINYSNRETNQGSQRATAYYDPAWLVGDLETENNTAISFASEDRSEQEVRDYYEEQENLTISADFKHVLDGMKLDYGFGYNKGDFAGDPNKDLRAFFRTDFQSPEGFYYLNTYDFQDGDAYNPVFGGDFVSAPASDYSIYEVRRGTRIIEDQSYSGYINLEKDISWGDVPGYIKAGVKYTNSERDFDDMRRRYRTADVDWTLESVVINGSEQVFGSVLADYGVDNALNGQDFRFMVDPDKVRAAEEALIAAGIRDENDPNWYLNRNESRDARADLVNSYDLDEEVLGGFVEAEARWEKVTLITGLRVESTDVVVDTYAGDFYEWDPDSDLYIQPIKGKNDYVDLFPHVHLKYDVSEDTIVRASVNRTMARPSYRQLNPSTDIDPTANNDDGLVIKGRTTLNPVESTNLDLSIDHYLGKGANVSLALFYKSMDNNIYRISRGVLASDPSYYPEDAEVREFLNADGAEVKGLEFAVNYRLDTLHEALYGLDISANYTYTDSTVDGIQREDSNGDLFSESGVTQLFGQVPHTVNVALNFARWGFESRLAWNWTDAYLDFGGIDVDSNLDDYLDSRSRLDFSLRYRFQNHWTVFLEIQNLLDDEVTAYEGDRSTRMYYREESGRLTVIGIRWNM